jgi:hypothetical protein
MIYAIIDYNEETLIFFLSEPDMDWLNHQCDMQIQACTYEDHRVYGPGVGVLLF